MATDLLAPGPVPAHPTDTLARAPTLPTHPRQVDAHNASQPSASPNAPRGRLDYVDTLKVLLTVLVIAHHAGQPYGPTGGRWPLFDAQRAAILGPFFSVNAAFFMGLFFLISAYFVPASFDRKGAGPFVRDRLVRLGIPFVVIGLTIGALSHTTFDPAHLWFVSHLLVYAGLYAAWRLVPATRVRLGVPGQRAIVGYACLLAGVTVIVRTAGFPQDRWVMLLGVLPVELAHLPQYASLFVIGLLAAHNDWLTRLPTRTGMLWLAIGLTLAAARYAFFFVADSPLDTSVWAVWEAFLCVGLCVGLPVLFRELGARARLEGRVLRGMAPNAYGAYVVHVMPVVVGVQFLLAQLSLDPLAKFALVTLLGVPLSFALSAALRRIPAVRAVL
jgi:fucose 4-O-acetylase-like acetyltransferase